MKLTALMNKVFSNTDQNFNEIFSAKLDEARSNGSASLSDEANNLYFSEVEGDVVIEDKNNRDEATVAKDVDGETVLSPLEEVTKSHSSATLPDADVKKLEGNDDKDPLPEDSTVPDVKVTVKDGILDEDKSGTNKNYSIVISGFKSPEQAENYYNNMNKNYTEGTVSFSEVDGLRLQDASNALFSEVELLDENSTFSEFEYIEESLNALYSALDEAESRGVNVDVLRYYADVATETAQEAAEAAAAKAEEDEACEDAAKEVATEANSVYSAMEEFIDAPDVEMAHAIYSSCDRIFSACEQLNQEFGVNADELMSDVSYFSEVVSDYVESQLTFSDEDAEALAEKAETLEEAGKELEETKDPELAKKVKVLSEEVSEDADAAEEAGANAGELKEMCQQYSDLADSILGEYSVNSRSYSEPEGEVVAQGVENRSFSNPCLSSPIN